ncbi:MAG: general secretion pathway protein C [Alteromonadaceae bacterium]|jgi:general secretion pathway protein C
MQLPNNLTPFIEVLARLPQQKIARALSILLIVYVAYLAAQLTWLLLSPNASQSSTGTQFSAATKNEKNQGVELDKLYALNLFGDFNEEVDSQEEIAVQDAPETQLRLTLSGVVASDDSKVAAAVIENNGKQETYGIGDTITGTRAILEGVSSDRVLIKQSGRLETLMLDGFKYEKAKTNSTASNIRPKRPPRRENQNPSLTHTLDQRNNRELTRQATSLKADINEDPGKITDYLRIVPKRQAGKVIGYQLMPGKKPEFFETSGLKSGDVATQMNGYDLSIPSEAAQALQALKQQKEVSLLLNRNGELTEILFSIDE